MSAIKKFIEDEGGVVCLHRLGSKFQAGSKCDLEASGFVISKRDSNALSSKMKYDVTVGSAGGWQGWQGWGEKRSKKAEWGDGWKETETWSESSSSLLLT